VEVLDYDGFRDAIVDALSSQDLETSIDEAVFLGSSSRGCEIFVHPDPEPSEVWGKISFEWAAGNQALYESYKDGEGEEAEIDPSDPYVEVIMHLAFHLHFGALSISTDAVRDVAQEIQETAAIFFGDDGGVIAEVSMTSSEAKLECLRFEVETSAPIFADDAWWDRLADVCRTLVDKLQAIFVRLNSEFGSPRGNV